MKPIDPNISTEFAKGLAVFSGKSTFEKILRGKFTLMSSTIADRDIFYVDQWLPQRVGGGQEILKVAGEGYTRVYAGGTVEDAILLQLGITKDDVMEYLKKTLLAAQDKTRFAEKYEMQEGVWKYEFTPGDVDHITGLMTGKEVIIYKDSPVFVHLFIISRVSE